MNAIETTTTDFKNNKTRSTRIQRRRVVLEIYITHQSIGAFHVGICDEASVAVARLDGEIRARTGIFKVAAALAGA